MMLRVGEGERRSPRAAEDHPFVDLEVCAQALEVRDEVLGGVLLEAAQRRRAPRAALVEQDDAIERGVEELAVRGRCAWAGPAVQENHGHAVGSARLLVVHAMRGMEVQRALTIGL